MRHKRMVPAAAFLAVGAIFLSACNVQRITQDVFFIYDSGNPFSMQINESDVPDDPGTPGDQGQARDGYEHIYEDIDLNCVNALNEDEDEGTVGSWGTVGSSTNTTTGGHVVLTSVGTPPSEDTVNCFIDEVIDNDPEDDDPESMVCDDANTVNDCQDPDGSANYVNLVDETAFYQTALGGSYDDALNIIVLIRDYFSETITDPIGGGPGAPGCIGVRIDSTWRSGSTNFGNGGVSAEWRRVCLQ